MNVYFSDVFNVPAEKLEDFGAFNISIVTEFPLFVDPFARFAYRPDLILKTIGEITGKN